jgi:hypothetical protein
MDLDFKTGCARVRIGLFGIKQARRQAELTGLLWTAYMHRKNIFTTHGFDDAGRADFTAFAIVERHFQIGTLLEGGHINVDAQARRAVVLDRYGLQFQDAHVLGRERDDALFGGVQFGEEKFEVIVGHVVIITTKSQVEAIFAL